MKERISNETRDFICELYFEYRRKQTAIALVMGIPQGTVSRIIKEHDWRRV